MNKAFPRSLLPRTLRTADADCSYKGHCRGVVREVIGYLELRAKEDRDRFVWCGVDHITKNCKRYKGDRYGKRAVEYVLRFLERKHVISHRLKRRRGGVLREGFIVTPHDSLFKRTKNLCEFVGRNKAPGHWRRDPDGRAVLHAKAVGTVRVSAALGGEMRFREIKIWSAVRPIPPGTTNWGMDPIGREIGDLPAVPTVDAPETYSLEQTANGSTYLRAVRNDGIQVWTWLMPEQTHEVELVCGDWLGGALISAHHPSSYTLYTVGKDGKLRWQYTLAGLRKAHAYNLEHLVHVLSQSPDGAVTTVTGLDEVTGARKFELTLPASHEKQINVQKTGTKILCASKSSFSPVRTITSHLFVNIDGFAYVAFTQNDWVLQTAKCASESVIAPHDVNFVRDERVLLWQIHADGTYLSTIVEESKNNRPLSEPVSVASPTGSIIPDGLGGVLLPIRLSHNAIVEDVHGSPDELVYRINENGEVVYRFPLPKHDGVLHDEMVLGEDGLGFATRGSLLIAFNVPNGKEIWRWDSNTPGIEIFAALANGHCLVQTPTALVEVESADKSKEVFQGKAMMGWQGQIYRKHN